MTGLADDCAAFGISVLYCAAFGISIPYCAAFGIAGGERRCLSRSPGYFGQKEGERA